MIKIITAFLILVSVSQMHSQEFSKNELDSLYNLFTFIRGVNQSDKMQQQLDENPEIRKCGLGLVTAIKQNLKSFSIEQQNILFNLLERPQTQTSIVSSNGFFRVHYDLTGNNALGYDLNLLLEAIDSVYSFEINYLGYPVPPSDGSSGGDDKYDIYVINLGNTYGQTWYENSVGVTNWTSYVEIDNDFGIGFYTHGIDAARVTIAHEFHHAIQMGNYAQLNGNSAIRLSDTYFYEITSTSMEEFIFSSVNDYYGYMPGYFLHPELPMSDQSGYNMAIWNIYLQNNFGFEIIKNQWEQMPNKFALEAIALSIFQNGSTFGNELNRFGIWTYFTKSRTIPGRYFEEANNYPLITPTATVSFTPPSDTYDMTIGPVANYFLKINFPSPDGVFYSIITNSDYQKTLGQTFPFSFSVFQDTISGERVINKNYSVSFSNDNQQFWNNAGILNDVVGYGGSSFPEQNLGVESFAYPTPFRKSSSNEINIVFLSNRIPGEEVDLYIYSAGMELYFSAKEHIHLPRIGDPKKYREMTLNKSEANFSSGVYIYVIKSGDDIYKGKLVIFND